MNTKFVLLRGPGERKSQGERSSSRWAPRESTGACRLVFFLGMWWGGGQVALPK